MSVFRDLPMGLGSLFLLLQLLEAAVQASEVMVCKALSTMEPEGCVVPVHPGLMQCIATESRRTM